MENAKTFDALFVLSGSIHCKDGKWMNSTYGEPGDKHGATNSFARIVAASHLFRNKLTELIIFVGGSASKELHASKAPSLGSICKSEAMALGVPEQNIEIEVESGNTYQNLLFITKRVKESGMKKIAILSSDWHMDRVRAFIHKMDTLAELKEIEPMFFPAEDILLKYDKKSWEKPIQIFNASKDAMNRRKIEARGVRHIFEETYKIS